MGGLPDRLPPVRFGGLTGIIRLVSLQPALGCQLELSLATTYNRYNAKQEKNWYYQKEYKPIKSKVILKKTKQKKESENTISIMKHDQMSEKKKKEITMKQETITL